MLDELFDIIKAGFEDPDATSAAPEAASAPAISTGASGGSAPAAGPAGGGQPRAGHKYVSREWSGSHWVYDYGDAPSGGGKSHGPLAASDINDPKRSHSLDIAPGEHASPEHAYNASVAHQLPDKSKHTVPHPGGQGNLSVNVGKGGKLSVSDDKGDKQNFSSRGAFEKWHQETANTTTFTDHEGDPLFDIVPNAGSVKEGQYYPQQDTSGKEGKGRSWKILYNPKAPEHKTKQGGRKEQGYASSREAAEAKVKKLLADRESVSRQGENSEIESDLDAENKRASKPGSVAHALENGKFQYHIDPSTGRKALKVSPEQRQQIIEQTAKEFLPGMINQAKRAVFYKPEDINNEGKNIAIAQMVGVDPRSLEKDESGKPTFVGLDPKSPGYRAIDNALDTYDPSKRVKGTGQGSFTNWLAGSKGSIATQFRGWHGAKGQDAFAGQFNQDAGEGEIPTNVNQGMANDYSQSLSDEDPTNQETFGVKDWLNNQRQRISQLAQSDPKVREFAPHIETALKEIETAHPSEQAQHIATLSNILNSAGMGHVLVKSLTNYALLILKKALKPQPLLTKDKGINPEHEYSHKEDDSYYYKDPIGNYVRYSNAPSGHSDRESNFGDAKLHPSEPDFGSNPEFFTLDGRKLNRAPDDNPVNFQWNENYTNQDPNNMWVAKWVNQKGEFNYSYLDADLRTIPHLNIHQQNVTFDSRIPLLRQYAHDLYNSHHLKDQLTAVCIMLLDQGRFRVQELCSIKVCDVHIEGSLIALGNRKIHADSKVMQALQWLTSNKDPNDPLFMVPQEGKESEIKNEAIPRRIGPHYLHRVLDALGINIYGIQSYHLTSTFSKEMSRLLLQNYSFEQAKNQALLSAALEWGHDFSKEISVIKALQLIEELFIDPLVIKMIQRNSEMQNSGSNQMNATMAKPLVIIPQVSADLVTRNSEETEFSTWLHNTPVHTLIN